MLILFSLINVLVIMTGLGYDLPAGSIVPVLVGALLIVIGNYLPRIRSNFSGSKPLDIEQRFNLEKTHRFAAKVFTLAGLLIIADGLLSISPEIMLPVILATVFAPYIYSYVLYRKEINMKS